MSKPTSRRKESKESLDRYPAKRGVGRPRKVIPEQVRGRADNYRWILDQFLERLWPTLQLADCADDVTEEFKHATSAYANQFVPEFSSLILGTLREPDFPKRRKKLQIKFLADSIAGLGRISPRRSRDICQEQRELDKNTTRILRYEFYVECSCVYKGRSWDQACRECKAHIRDALAPSLGNQAFPPIKTITSQKVVSGDPACRHTSSR
jgi:hypothetical protein